MYATFRASDLRGKPWMIENRTAGARRRNDRLRDVGQPVELDRAGLRTPAGRQLYGPESPHGRLQNGCAI
jgi:hypothetical protein